MLAIIKRKENQPLYKQECIWNINFISTNSVLTSIFCTKMHLFPQNIVEVETNRINPTTNKCFFVIFWEKKKKILLTEIWDFPFWATYRMYMMTPRDQISQDLSYFSGPRTSGAERGKKIKMKKPYLRQKKIYTVFESLINKKRQHYFHQRNSYRKKIILLSNDSGAFCD